MPTPEQIAWMVELGILSWRDDDFEAMLRWGYVAREWTPHPPPKIASRPGQITTYTMTKTEVAALVKRILDKHGPSPAMRAAAQKP